MAMSTAYYRALLASLAKHEQPANEGGEVAAPKSARKSTPKS